MNGSNTLNRPIMLVEDNPMDVDLTIRAFARRKLVNSIEVARDGEDALAYLPRWESGEALAVVILFDLKLPKVSGLEVLRCLKSHPQFRAIPVVVLTFSAKGVVQKQRRTFQAFLRRKRVGKSKVIFERSQRPRRSSGLRVGG